MQSWRVPQTRIFVVLSKTRVIDCLSGQHQPLNYKLQVIYSFAWMSGKHNAMRICRQDVLLSVDSTTDGQFFTFQRERALQKWMCRHDKVHCLVRLTRGANERNQINLRRSCRKLAFLLSHKSIDRLFIVVLWWIFFRVYLLPWNNEWRNCVTWNLPRRAVMQKKRKNTVGKRCEPEWVFRKSKLFLLSVTNLLAGGYLWLMMTKKKEKS